MTKPRFLLICSSYPPVLGGSEVEAQRVCAEMLRRGYGVEVVCQGGEPMPSTPYWLDSSGVPVRMFGFGNAGAWRDRIYALGVAWTLITRRNHYDFIYFLMQGMHLAVGLPIARLLGKPVVMKVSGSNLISVMARSRLGRLELRLLRRVAFRVLVLNDGMRQEALQHGLQESQLMWMPNPVDTELFAPCDPVTRSQLRRRLAISQDASVVVYTGRLSAEKGLDTLVESFSKVARLFPEATLILVGEGTHRSLLETSVERLGIARQVRFTGRLGSKDVLSWLLAADVFALLSPDEGFSVSLLEALAAGLPAVVSAIPANLQLVREGMEGLTAAVGDCEATAGALQRLLEDSSLRQTMGIAARNRVAGEFSTGKVGDLYEGLFADLMRQPG